MTTFADRLYELGGAPVGQALPINGNIQLFYYRTDLYVDSIRIEGGIRGAR